MSENIILADNLTKRYRGFLAVNGISIKVKKGDFFGFLGPNGAGKTTTVRMLTGLTKISSGSVFLLNNDINKESKFIKSRIGIVEDVSNLFPDLTVYENLLFKSIIFGINYKKIKQMVFQYLELFNLTKKLRSKFSSLSRGQKRIISIISALIHSPDILFLDEPTLGLDVNARNKIHKLLQMLHKKGTTIFLTSHYFEEVEKLCNRLNVINNGNIIFNGNMKKLKSLFPGNKIISVEFNKNLNKSKIKRYFPNVKVQNNKIFVRGDDITVLLSQINKFIKQNKIKVIEINTEENKLEDLFLRLVKEDEK